MTPIHSLLARVRWDPEFGRGSFEIGYYDRVRHATGVGIIPFSVHNAYLGSIASDIATLGTRNAQRTPLEWGVYGAGFVALAAVLVYLNRLARRVLAKYTDDAQEADRCRG